jgi:hypothetical protein
MHVSWYHTKDMHFIVLVVKCDGGLSISVLINEQLFTKNWVFKSDQFPKKLKFSNLSNPAIWSDFVQMAES